MTNCNCLEGLACPKCGNDHRLIIEARTLADVTDRGAETFGHMAWDDSSFAECPDCGHHATLREFRAPPDDRGSTALEEDNQP